MLGGLTVLSTIVFRELQSNDGANVSQHRTIVPEGAQEIAGTTVAIPPTPVNDGGSRDRAPA